MTVERQPKTESLPEQIKALRKRFWKIYSSDEMRNLIHNRWLYKGGNVSEIGVEYSRVPASAEGVKSPSFYFRLFAPKYTGEIARYTIVRETQKSINDIDMEEIKSDNNSDLRVEVRNINGSGGTRILLEQEAVDKANEILDTLVLLPAVYLARSMHVPTQEAQRTYDHVANRIIDHQDS